MQFVVFAKRGFAFGGEFGRLANMEELPYVTQKLWVGDFLYLPMFKVVRAITLRAKELYWRQLLETKPHQGFYPFESAVYWQAKRTEAVEGVLYSDTSLIIGVRSPTAFTFVIYGFRDEALEREAKIRWNVDGPRITWVGATNGSQKIEHWADDFTNVKSDERSAAVYDFYKLPDYIQRTFVNVSNEPWVRPFYENKLSQGAGGVVLCFVKDGRILGVIGPLLTFLDNDGLRFLAPPYFVAAPDSRRQGVGRALWEAARIWAREAGAAYCAFSAPEDSPAVAFYEKMEVAKVGWRCLVD